jgi:hypothetical protein
MTTYFYSAFDKFGNEYFFFKTESDAEYFRREYGGVLTTIVTDLIWRVLISK